MLSRTALRGGLQSVQALAPFAAQFSSYPNLRRRGHRSALRYVKPEEAVSCIKSNDIVFVHSIAAAPQMLIKAMTRVALERNLTNVRPLHLHTEGAAPYAIPAASKSFRPICLFTAANTRQAVNEGRADFIPCFLSEVTSLMVSCLPPDVGIFSLSPPDKHGYCSLGPSIDVSLSAFRMAKKVVGQVNKFLPRTHGDGAVHISELDAVIECHEPLPTPRARVSAVDKLIGNHVAKLIPDGACLQMGIGAIPDAVVSGLKDRKHLGIHTELMSDGVIPLIQSGAVDNSMKEVYRGKVATSFALGSQKLYDLINDNPFFHFGESMFLNDPRTIRMNSNAHAINSCIEIDLTGQIVSDSIGQRLFSGVGGQVDFVRGASLSPGGKAIIALPSTTTSGASRIAPACHLGGGVVTTRAHAHWVATEYGAVDLHGKTIVERAHLLISIAHPRHRHVLSKAARARFGVSWRDNL